MPRKRPIKLMKPRVQERQSTVAVLSSNPDADAHRQAARKVYFSARWTKLSAKMRQQFPRCGACGTSDDLTVDHIYPLRMMTPEPHRDPRAYDPANLRVLCRSCNTKERNRLMGGPRPQQPNAIHRLRESLSWLDDPDE